MRPEPKIQTKAKTVTPLADAPPPFHTVAILIGAGAACLRALPSLESLDTSCTVRAFSAPLFPSLIPSALWLGLVRISLAALIFGTQAALARGGGWVQLTAYRPGTRLVASPIYVRGWRTLCPFTSWAWNLLGTSFALNGCIALLVAFGCEDHLDRNPWVLRAALVVFEAAAPSSMLVSSVIRYAIWPNCLGSKGPRGTAQLRMRTILLQHNANIILALTEVGLLGGVPVRQSDFAVAPLFGIAYVLFAYSIRRRLSEDGTPQFLYFFLDTTLGKTTSIALVVLLAVLLTFYGLFSVVDDLLEGLGGGAAKNALVVAGLASLFCRFQD